MIIASTVTHCLLIIYTKIILISFLFMDQNLVIQENVFSYCLLCILQQQRLYLVHIKPVGILAWSEKSEGTEVHQPDS